MSGSRGKTSREGALQRVVLLTALGGAASLAACIVSLPSIDPTSIVALASIGLAAGLVSVQLPSKHAHLAPTEPFVLAGLVLVGPWAPVLGAVAAAFGPLLLGKSRSIQTIFNVAAALIAGAAASWVFMLLGGSQGVSVAEAILPIVGAALTFGLVNGALVAAVVSIARSRALARAFDDVFLSAGVAHVAGPLLALSFLAIHEMGWLLQAALAIPALMVGRALLQREPYRLSSATGSS